jgi:hypothetical protein
VTGTALRVRHLAIVTGTAKTASGLTKTATPSPRKARLRDGDRLWWWAGLTKTASGLTNNQPPTTNKDKNKEINTVSSSEEYKRQIMRDLAQGNTESLEDTSTEEYQNFDDFAQRTTPSQRRQMFERSFNSSSIPPSQMEPELQKAIANIKPNERDDVARAFFKHLKQRGLDERQLEQQLSLSTHNPNRMSADDVSRLASFAYHNHPDIFREVLAEQPAIIKFLSNPIVGAIVGLAAAKWLGGRK